MTLPFSQIEDLSPLADIESLKLVHCKFQPIVFRNKFLKLGIDTLNAAHVSSVRVLEVSAKKIVNSACLANIEELSLFRFMRAGFMIFRDFPA
jgi:hypothetical protein